jgi:hypothetical protein
LGFRATQVAYHHLPAFGDFTHGVATNRQKHDLLAHFEMSACLSSSNIEQRPAVAESGDPHLTGGNPWMGICGAGNAPTTST